MENEQLVKSLTEYQQKLNIKDYLEETIYFEIIFLIRLIKERGEFKVNEETEKTTDAVEEENKNCQAGEITEEV